MPRARRRCAKPDCRNFQPCATHPQGWASARSKNPLPRDWKSRKKFVEYRSGGRCEWNVMGVRCVRPADGGVDHIIPRFEWPQGRPGLHDYNNLQSLCKLHHTQKTNEEKKRALQKKYREGG